MAFLTRTRLRRWASGSQGNPTLIQPPSILGPGQVGQIADTVEEAMLFIPAGQRPGVNSWWQYYVELEVQSHVVPTLRGMAVNDPLHRTVVFDVDFWETEAARLTPLASLRRNTFVHQFTQKSRDGALAAVRQSVDDYLIRAELAAFPADGRDFRIVVTTDPASDPLDLLTRLSGFDGQPIDLPTRWRTP